MFLINFLVILIFQIKLVAYAELSDGPSQFKIISNGTNCLENNKHIVDPVLAKVLKMACLVFEKNPNASSFVYIIDTQKHIQQTDQSNNGDLKRSGQIQSSGKDITGAKLYVVLLLSIYAIITLLILASRVKPATEANKERREIVRAEYLLQRVQEHTETQNILEQLSDQSYREKIWNIYRNSVVHHADDARSTATEHNMDSTQPQPNLKIMSVNEQNTLKDIEKKMRTLQKYTKNLEEKSVDYIDLKSSSGASLNTRSAASSNNNMPNSESSQHMGSFKKARRSSMSGANSQGKGQLLRVHFQNNNSELIKVLKEWRAGSHLLPKQKRTASIPREKSVSVVSYPTPKKFKPATSSSSSSSNNRQNNFQTDEEYYYTVSSPWLRAEANKLLHRPNSSPSSASAKYTSTSHSDAYKASYKFDNIPLIVVNSDHSYKSQDSLTNEKKETGFY